MHGASMGEEWAKDNRAEEEAGIVRLDEMATSEERLQTLNAVRLVRPTVRERVRERQ
jgi:hypothetical protein